MSQQVNWKPKNENASVLVGLRYALYTPPPPPAPVVAPVAAPALARTYLVFFDWDKYNLTERAKQIIAEAAGASRKVQTTRIEVRPATPTAPARPSTTSACRSAAPMRSRPSWSARASPATRSRSAPMARAARSCRPRTVSASRRTAASRSS